MNIKVWGCRGSLPSPGPENNKYGGNTSCVQVYDEDTCIILDAGSGIQRLGRFLSPEIKEIHILLTHLHIDHTMGLGFFLPLYNPTVEVHLWGPSSSTDPLLQRLRRYFSAPLFPVRLGDLPNHPIIHELSMTDFELGRFKIKSEYVCHPGPTLAYRIQYGDSIFAYIPDHELRIGSADFPNNPEWTSGFEIANNADLLFHDGSYSIKEYPQKIGWGHSAVKDVISFAQMCKVKRLAVFHHEPTNTDQQLDEILMNNLKDQTFDFQIEMCMEGNTYSF
ncbi:Phosphoribosyl 1,2-cyclic phosphodiesterase [Algoriphagus ornithinivorans]|uniref:Phosphoribosyl 1,2-cyclic phosphodiesterase n=1 Tax=Algoriphagus ornithinivorans TaxID=226506 RepID=A0A1I5A713_9BACT|nr:MBL fold metallo-hydrolase [Algoriphagus ornithinivorans]SFN58227.1 Phosphoribosyl 1,2-cyclic phosphodiesterase [Algoriphagus ornithinivorans]